MRLIIEVTSLSELQRYLANVEYLINSGRYSQLAVKQLMKTRSKILKQLLECQLRYFDKS